MEQKIDHGLTVGNILTILIIVGGLIVQYASLSAHLAKIDTNMEWVMNGLKQLQYKYVASCKSNNEINSYEYHTAMDR